jgi:hypothetical protein
LNYYIAEIPARIIKPVKTLIIENDTLSSVPKVYPHSKSISRKNFTKSGFAFGKKVTSISNNQVILDAGGGEGNPNPRKNQIQNQKTH